MFECDVSLLCVGEIVSPGAPGSRANIPWIGIRSAGSLGFRPVAAPGSVLRGHWCGRFALVGATMVEHLKVLFVFVGFAVTGLGATMIACARRHGHCRWTLCEANEFDDDESLRATTHEGITMQVHNEAYLASRAIEPPPLPPQIQKRKDYEARIRGGAPCRGGATPSTGTALAGHV